MSINLNLNLNILFKKYIYKEELIEKKLEKKEKKIRRC
jgi:hypothetical protein